MQIRKEQSFYVIGISARTSNAIELSGNLKRAYIADYVIYDKRSHDPSNAMVDIYVGLKE